MKLNSINDVLMKNNYQLNRTGDWHWRWNELIDETLTLCLSFYWFLLVSCSRDPAVTSFNQKSPGEQKKPTTRIHRQPTGAHPFRQLISENTTTVFFIFTEKPQSKPETYLYISSAWEEWIVFRPDQACLVPWRSGGGLNLSLGSLESCSARSLHSSLRPAGTRRYTTVMLVILHWCSTSKQEKSKRIEFEIHVRFEKLEKSLLKCKKFIITSEWIQ